MNPVQLARCFSQEVVTMETNVGHITHYYNRINVAVLSLNDVLKINDCVRFLGHTTDFTQRIWSMEIEHQKIQTAGPGFAVAIKVAGPVRKGDQVYLIPEEALEEIEL